MSFIPHIFIEKDEECLNKIPVLADSLQWLITDWVLDS